eukprot:60215-Hanusia_phi.AAC.1
MMIGPYPAVTKSRRRASSDRPDWTHPRPVVPESAAIPGFGVGAERLRTPGAPGAARKSSASENDRTLRHIWGFWAISSDKGGPSIDMGSQGGWS